MEMKKYKLGEIAEIYNGSTPSTLDDSNYDGDIIWATPKDLSDQNSKYFTKGARNITQKGFDSCSTRMIPANNILMSSRAPIGLFAINTVDCCTNQGFKNIVLDKTISDVDFMYYYLKYHVKEIEALGSGTTFKEISKTSFEKYEISLPPLPIQQKIAAVLSNIDRKISLNREINRNLEELAKQIYDYWFVQFDFPNEEGKPYKTSGGKMVYNEVLKKEIPDGWEVKRIFDCADVLYGFPFATEPFDEDVKNSEKSFSVIRIRDILNNTISAKTNENPGIKYKTQINDLLIGMDGYFHMNFCCRNGDYVNQRIVRIRKTEISSLLIYHQIKPFIEFKERQAKGSTVGHLSDKDMKSINIIIPDNKSISVKFDAILSKISKNIFETQNLVSLRDSLLPLLMNGQVTLK